MEIILLDIIYYGIFSFLIFFLWLTIILQITIFSNENKNIDDIKKEDNETYVFISKLIITTFLLFCFFIITFRLKSIFLILIMILTTFWVANSDLELKLVLKYSKLILNRILTIYSWFIPIFLIIYYTFQYLIS